MASLVGAILFLRPFTLPIFHSPFPTSISHFHFPLSFTTPQAAARCCRIVFHAGSPAERQLFRTDFRFAPSPRRASLAGPPIHEDMVVHGLCGRVPDSAGNACSLNCCCSGIANLSAHLHRLPTPPPYLRPMRLLHGRGAGVGCKMRLSPARAQVLDGKCCCCLAWVPFLQITARTNPCSRHLWGTLARSVASI